MKCKYDKIFYFSFINIVFFILIYWAININLQNNLLINLQSIPNLSLMLLFVLISILIRILPIYKADDKDIQENITIIKIYEAKFIIFIISSVFLLLQLISMVSKKNGYYGDVWIIFSVGMIAMSYSNDLEDIIYIIHKLKLDSYKEKAYSNYNLYYLLGYKLNKLFKNDILENMSTFQLPSLHMEILAIHSSFDSAVWDDRLRKFYKNLIAYILDKNYIAGTQAINSLSEKIDEIKSSKQEGKTKSAKFEFDFESLRNGSRLRMSRKYILANNILDKSWNSIIIIILVGISSIIYITNWIGGNG